MTRARWSQPFQSIWNAATPYKTGTDAVVLYQGGWWLVAADNLNSTPASGNADWTLVGGLLYADIFLDPPTLSGGLYDSISGKRSVIGVNQGTRTFTVDLSPLGWRPGSILRIHSSTGNDGDYTVVSVTLTTVTVAEAIPDPTADGTLAGPGITAVPAPGLGRVLVVLAEPTTFVGTDGIAWNAANSGLQLTYGPPYLNSNISGYGVADLSGLAINTVSDVTPVGNTLFENQPLVLYTSVDLTAGGSIFGTRTTAFRLYYDIVPGPSSYPVFFAISNVNQGTKTFTVSPTPVGTISNSDTVTVVGSTGNNASYTVASRTATTVVVTQAIPSATADGWMKK